MKIYNINYHLKKHPFALGFNSSLLDKPTKFDFKFLAFQYLIVLSGEPVITTSLLLFVAINKTLLECPLKISIVLKVIGSKISI